MLPVDDRVGPARSQQLFVGPLTTVEEGPHPLAGGVYLLRYINSGMLFSRLPM